MKGRGQTEESEKKKRSEEKRTYNRKKESVLKELGENFY